MSHTALILREYESARIGSSWNAMEGVVSRKDVALIDLHQRETGRNLFTLGYRSIKATNWVGVLGIGNHCIEVVPKIDEPSELAARENLLHMVQRGGLVPLATADIARLANTNKPLLTAYMELYVDHLAREWRKGQIRRYVVSEENRSCLKGKLLLSAHFKRNILHKERFYTATDEFTPDNEVSQLLKAALMACYEQRHSTPVSQKAKMLLPDFEEVQDVPVSSINLDGVRVDRRISRFEPLLNMARFILEHVSPSPANAGSAVYSLMFDMNDVFEHFIAAEMKTALRSENVRVRYQVKGKSLVRKNGRKKFALKPDIGVFRKRENVCLVDTKWKRLDMTRTHNNVSQADIYQMYAYGKEYDSPRVVLLYPKHKSVPDNVSMYEHVGEEPAKRIEIKTIDVSSPFSRREVRSALRSRLSSIALGG